MNDNKLQFNVEVYELRAVTRQVAAVTPQEAIQAVNDFYSSGRVLTHGEPKVMSAYTIQWYVSIREGAYDGWYDDETQYKTTYEKDLGPFDTFEQARDAALNDTGTWRIELEQSWGETWRWYQETDARGYRSVDVVGRAAEKVELPSPAPSVGTIEP